MADLNPIEALFAAVRSYDDGLNAREVAPTGDCYNNLYDLIQAAERRLLAEAAALPCRVTIRWGEEAADDDVKTHSFASKAERVAFLEGVDAADGWMAHQIESAEG